MKRTACLIAFIILLAPGAFFGQIPEHRDDLSLLSGQAVPQELVLRLLKARPSRAKGEPSLLLGEAPRHFLEQGFLPKRGQVLASLVWDRNTTVLLDTEDLPEEVQAQYRGLIDLGWRRYHPNYQSAGFQPAPDHSSWKFCFGEDKSLLIATERIEAKQSQKNLTQVTLILNEGKDRAGCGQHLRGPVLPDSPFPVLYAPEGAETSGGGWSYGETRQQNSQSLTTKLSPVELLLHYGAQMEEQHWLPEAPNDYGPVAFQSWLFEDESGVPWHGLLIVSGPTDGKGRRHAELTILNLGGDDNPSY